MLKAPGSFLRFKVLVVLRTPMLHSGSGSTDFPPTQWSRSAPILIARVVPLRTTRGSSFIHTLRSSSTTPQGNRSAHQPPSIPPSVPRLSGSPRLLPALAAFYRSLILVPPCSANATQV